MALARIPYLFDPDEVRATLADFPSLAGELRPEREREKAEWFERVFKSERQIYRVLGNTHYAHLTELLEALDGCVAHGYKQPRLLKTRARSSFAPDLAEIRVAEHFALAGCEIEGFDDSKGEESVPDLRATTPAGFRVAVEVYCPLVFEYLKRFHDDLVSGIKNIDLPWDFVFRISFEKLRIFDDQHRLTYLHDDILDQALKEDGRGQTIVAALLGEMAAKLNDPPDALAISRAEDDLNLKLELELSHIEQTPNRLPARAGVYGYPHTLPPRPEWMFEQIAERAEVKARKQQALQVEADAAVLVVDLSEADLPSELRHEGYRNMFREILAPRADEALHGHTAIVFTESAGWHEPFIPWFLNTASCAPRELLDLLDPRGIYVRS
jgi:hypothetical protein